MAKRTPLQELHEAWIGFKGDKGLEAFGKLIKIRITFDNYSKNYLELQKTLEKANGLPDTFFIQDNAKRWNLQKEIGRKMGNTILTADIFLDQNKRQKKTAEMYFMSELRNFIVHREAIYISTFIRKDFKREIHYRYDTFQQSTFAEYLKKRKEQSSKSALSYMSVLEEKINLHELLSDYNDTMQKIYENRVLNFVQGNYNSLAKLLDEVDKLRIVAKKLNLESDRPITRSQYRYLQRLLNKVG